MWSLIPAILKMRTTGLKGMSGDHYQSSQQIFTIDLLYVHDYTDLVTPYMWAGRHACIDDNSIGFVLVQLPPGFIGNKKLGQDAIIVL